MADLTVPESAQGAFNPVQSGQERLGVAIPSAPMPNVQASAKVQKAASTYEQDAQALITGTKSGTVGAYTPLFESDPERIRATRLKSLEASIFPMARQVIDAWEEQSRGFERQQGYNVLDDLGERVQKELPDISPEERSFLMEARSSEQMNHRLKRVFSERLRRQAQADNPVTSFAGEMIDVTAVMGAGGAAVSKAYRVSRAAAFGVGVGAAGITTASTQGYDMRSENQKLLDMFFVGAGAAFGVGARASKIKSLKSGEEITSGTITKGSTSFSENIDNSINSVPVQEAPVQPSGGGLGLGATKGIQYRQTPYKKATGAKREATEAIHYSNNTLKKATRVQRERILESLGATPEDIQKSSLQSPKEFRETASAYMRTRAQEQAQKQAQKQASTPREYTAIRVSAQEDTAIRVSAQEVQGSSGGISGMTSPRTDPAGGAVKHTDTLEVRTDDGVQHVPVREFENTNTAGAWARAKALYKDVRDSLSSRDELKVYSDFVPDTQTRELIGERLLADPVHDNYDTVIARAVTHKRRGETSLHILDETLGDVVREYYGGGSRLSQFNPLQRAAQNRAERAAQRDFSTTLMRVQALEDDAIAAGNKFNLNAALNRVAPNDGIKRAVREYVDSNFAQEHMQAMKRTGVRGADELQAREVYSPLRWDYNAVISATRRGIPLNEIARWFGSDLARRFPDLIKGNRTVESLGSEFLRTQKEIHSGLHGRLQGTTRESLEAMLTNRGMSNKEATALTDKLYNTSLDRGKAHNLHRRNRWDMQKQYAYQGQVYTLADFADHNIMENLHTYNHMISHREALAATGIQGESDLRSLFQQIIDNAPEDTNIEGIKTFLNNTTDQLLGRAVGEYTPPWMRNSTIIGSALHLSNSGIYNAMDLMTTANEIGMRQMITKSVQALPEVFRDISKLSKSEAARLKDVLAADVLAEGRLKNFVTHFDDNHTVNSGTFSSAIANAAQSVKYLNASEYLRRWNVHIIASAYEDMIQGAVQGNKKFAEYFKSIGMSDELMGKIRKEIDTHGMLVNKWDADVGFDTQRYMSMASDNLAMTVHAGEVPALLEQTVTGKIIFPYMRYAFAGNQKILRRVNARSGLAGVAMLLAAQAPLSAMLAATVNVTNGKEWDDNLAIVAMRTATSLGYISLAIDPIASGGFTNSAVVLSPLTSTLRLGKALVNEDSSLYDVTNNVPFMGVSVLNMAIGVAKSAQEE